MSLSDATSSRNEKAIVRDTVINCRKAPRLKGVSTRHIIKIKRLRQLYKKKIKKKCRQLKDNIVLTSKKTSTEDEELDIFIAARWTEDLFIDEITQR